jgi:DNA-binding transcriptional LysR family regulator
MPRGLVAALPIAWIGPHNGFLQSGRPVPLVLSDPPCTFRQAVIDSLDRVNIPWRIAFTSPHLPALWAATEAGLGIMPRTAVGLPKSLTILEADADLPPLPHVPLALYAVGDPLPAAVASFQAIVIEALTVALPVGSIRQQKAAAR